MDALRPTLASVPGGALVDVLAPASATWFVQSWLGDTTLWTGCARGPPASWRLLTSADLLAAESGASLSVCVAGPAKVGTLLGVAECSAAAAAQVRIQWGEHYALQIAPELRDDCVAKVLLADQQVLLAPLECVLARVEQRHAPALPSFELALKDEGEEEDPTPTKRRSSKKRAKRTKHNSKRARDADLDSTTMTIDAPLKHPVAPTLSSSSATSAAAPPTADDGLWDAICSPVPVVVCSAYVDTRAALIRQLHYHEDSEYSSSTSGNSSAFSWGTSSHWSSTAAAAGSDDTPLDQAPPPPPSPAPALRSPSAAPGSPVQEENAVAPVRWNRCRVALDQWHWPASRQLLFLPPPTAAPVLERLWVAEGEARSLGLSWKPLLLPRVRLRCCRAHNHAVDVDPAALEMWGKLRLSPLTGAKSVRFAVLVAHDLAPLAASMMGALSSAWSCHYLGTHTPCPNHSGGVVALPSVTAASVVGACKALWTAYHQSQPGTVEGEQDARDELVTYLVWPTSGTRAALRALLDELAALDSRCVVQVVPEERVACPTHWADLGDLCLSVFSLVRRFPVPWLQSHGGHDALYMREPPFVLAHPMLDQRTPRDVQSLHVAFALRPSHHEPAMVSLVVTDATGELWEAETVPVLEGQGVAGTVWAALRRFVPAAPGMVWNVVLIDCAMCTAPDDWDQPWAREALDSVSSVVCVALQRNWVLHDAAAPAQQLVVARLPTPLWTGASWSTPAACVANHVHGSFAVCMVRAWSPETDAHAVCEQVATELLFLIRHSDHAWPQHVEAALALVR